jgi:hypothetical protein
MRYRLPFALAAVKGHARWHGSLGSPLTAVALQDCPNYERHEPLSPQLAARRWRPSEALDVALVNHPEYRSEHGLFTVRSSPMNGCSYGVFMIRWRFAHPETPVESSARSLQRRRSIGHHRSRKFWYPLPTAESLKNRGPWRLVYTELYETRSADPSIPIRPQSAARGITFQLG